MIKKLSHSKKIELRNKLRKLDSKLKNLYTYSTNSFYINMFPNDCKKLSLLDEKRKEVRNKLK